MFYAATLKKRYALKILAADYAKMEINMKFLPVMPISFCTRLAKFELYAERHTGKHFVHIVKSCLIHPKACKSNKKFP